MEGGIQMFSESQGAQVTKAGGTAVIGSDL